jgi:nitrogen fixation NifU-like protein
MFSAAVLDHFENPRHAGELDNATARVESSNPVCSDVLRLAARVENGRIVEARFLCKGCTTAIACGSYLTERINGQLLGDLRKLDANSISEGLGGLPAATFHGAQLAVDALQSLLRALMKG